MNFGNDYIYFFNTFDSYGLDLLEMFTRKLTWCRALLHPPSAKLVSRTHSLASSAKNRHVDSYMKWHRRFVCVNYVTDVKGIHTTGEGSFFLSLSLPLFFPLMLSRFFKGDKGKRHHHICWYLFILRQTIGKQVGQTGASLQQQVSTHKYPESPACDTESLRSC